MLHIFLKKAKKIDYIFNPRRDDFEPNAEQKKENKYFHDQVSWELNALEVAETILMYFAPDTKAPITLLELGLFADSKKLIVCCPKDFWRRGNVEIICERYNINLHNGLESAKISCIFKG